jgi:hypothetical protein
MAVVRNLVLTGITAGTYASARLGLFGTTEVKLVDVYGCGTAATLNTKTSHHRYILADNFNWRTDCVDAGTSFGSKWSIRPIEGIVVDANDNEVQRHNVPDDSWRK